MRGILSAALFAFLFFVAQAGAQNNVPADVKGLWIVTDYPNVTLKAGEETKLGISLINYNLAPQRTDLSVRGVPANWSAELRGGGRPVAAAFVEHNQKSNLDLQVKVPSSAKPGAYTLTVAAKGTGQSLELPITVNVIEQKGARLTATPKLPVLRGTPKSSFDFKVDVKNDSAEDILATLTSGAPRGFQVTFKEGYGSQELTSIPIKAGESKELSVDIKPAPGTNAGKYDVPIEIGSDKARATTKLTLDVSGQPQVSLSSETERLSGDAYAGQEKRFTFVLRNNGTADARNIELSSTPPNGWKITFEPKGIPSLAPNSEAKFEAVVVPSDKAVTGDYMFTVRANGDGVSETVNFRTTVLTSTLWGVIGLGVIAASLLVLFGAVGRFGRR
ncbi:MAG: NEW3 domain-containing protein [Hyphomicrobiaceae bacterium]